jgi:hypothetical protein
MGILDDAIREHLDLKRRRGADPAEIERAEREALGPVRRGPEPIQSDDPALELRTQVPLGYEAHDETWEEPFNDDSEPFPGAFPERPASYEEPGAYHDPPARYEPLLERDAAAYEESPRREQLADYELEPEHEQQRTPEPPLTDDPFDQIPPQQLESAPHAPHPAPGELQPSSDETAEYDVEEGSGKKGDDVLEETPEFLQDAPEHDRLWFEQRPPRDFDFNE